MVREVQKNIYALELVFPNRRVKSIDEIKLFLIRGEEQSEERRVHRKHAKEGGMSVAFQQGMEASCVGFLQADEQGRALSLRVPCLSPAAFYTIHPRYLMPATKAMAKTMVPKKFLVITEKSSVQMAAIRKRFSRGLGLKFPW